MNTNPSGEKVVREKAYVAGYGDCDSFFSLRGTTAGS